MLFDLDISYTLLLCFCLLCACGFEFVNGFHDTANAVATVIYTNALPPRVAVVWSGICNFLGVHAGGIAVAMGIVNLLPVETLIDQDIHHSLAMVFSLLLTAIIWNVGTWYYGLPSSSSHTLIGSILGVGLAFSFLPTAQGAAVNWSKAGEIGMSLILSPLFGFGVAFLLMKLLAKLSTNPALFREPVKNTPPPPLIRGVLLLTCTGVSFSHGVNDGQKGVGLIMLILIGIVPAYFALDKTLDILPLAESTAKVQKILGKVSTQKLSLEGTAEFTKLRVELAELQGLIKENKTNSKSDAFAIRRNLLLINRNLDAFSKNKEISLSDSNKKEVTKQLAFMRTYTDYAPSWVILLISISLGLGTMVGWKRIVTTIGERIGKEHLNYAQGMSSEVVAASTIGLSSYFGLPVSTTHVLSSGIAGSMVANNGVNNLQGGTVRSIALAWLLTLPFTIIVSGSLYLVLRAII
jgi:phosphate/sulfate permease